MGCCSVLALIFLVAINLITFIGSGVILVFGIIAKVNPDTAADWGKYVLPEASQSELEQMGLDVTHIIIANAVFMIIIGAIGIFISSVGLFGSCCTVRWMLITYIVLMVILFIGELAPILFAALYPQTFKKLMQTSMQKTLINDFKEEIRISETNDIVMPTGAVELAWATIQLKEQCCGAMNWTDYAKISWDNSKVALSGIFSGKAAVPVSCCLQKQPLTFPPTYVSFVDIQACLNGKQTAINNQNCYDALGSFVQHYRGVAIGIAAGIAAIEVILIVTAIVRCERLRHTRKYVKFSNE